MQCRHDEGQLKAGLLSPLAHLLALLRSFVRSRSLTDSLQSSRKKENYVYQFNAAISYRFNPLCSVIMTRDSKRLARSHLPLTSRSFTCSVALISSLARPLTRSRADEKDIYVYQFNAAISYHFNPLCSAAMMRDIKRLACSHLSHIHLLCCAHSFARSLTQSSWKRDSCLSI